ncbi:MAG: transcription termination/antitermination protein NusG [Candidatus Acidiferrales bacterium]
MPEMRLIEEASPTQIQQAAAEPAFRAERIEDEEGAQRLHWYAAYTCANHEKRVAEQLASKSIEQFLPLYDTVRRWKDRKVKLQRPLFPGYVFVRARFAERVRILEIPSVARLVGFNGRPAVLPEDEIETLRKGLEMQVRAEPHPFLRAGRRVIIRSGPLAGLRGILLCRKNRLRVLITIELLMRSIAVEADLADLEFPPV